MDCGWLSERTGVSVGTFMQPFNLRPSAQPADSHSEVAKRPAISPADAKSRFTMHEGGPCAPPRGRVAGDAFAVARHGVAQRLTGERP